MKQRNIGIDILKCFAAIVITNSHMDILYPKFGALATGGAIGDALFFFCSGFTLFLGRMGRFDNWYKRRINRIYPTVFAWAILGSLLFGYHNDINNILLSGGGWFVSCIMLYYVLLYFIQRYLLEYLKLVFTIVMIICASYFVLIDTPMDFNMYGVGYFKWFHFFMFMLMGAMMGIAQREYRYHFVWDGLKLIGCVVVFYALYAFKDIAIYNKFQMLTWIPLLGTVFYFFKLCNSDFMKKVYHQRIVGWNIKLVGGLCLEIYLVQTSLFTDKMNAIFPFNLIVMFAIIVLAAYILRCGARLFAQTFKNMDYDWKAVFKVV